MAYYDKGQGKSMSTDHLVEMPDRAQVTRYDPQSKAYRSGTLHRRSDRTWWFIDDTDWSFNLEVNKANCHHVKGRADV